MSWKKYGGTYKTDVLNSASINHLVAGTFIVRDSYVGVLDICGSMHVSEDIYYGRDLFGGRDASLNGNLLIGGETGILGNVKLGGNVYVSQDATLGSWLSVTGNVTMGGNLAVGDNATVGNNLSVRNRLYFGNSLNTFIKSSPGQSMGVNVSTPAAAAWDISGSRIEQLHVYTTADTAKSVLVQNARGHGVAMTGTDVSSSLVFYVDTSMNPAGAGGAGNTIAKSAPDGAITMFAGGNMRIDASSNILMSSRMVVSNISPTANGTWPATSGLVSAGSKHVNDEALVVYDLTRASTLLPDYYNYSSNAALSGTAATLVANDASSTTFMRWSTPALTGWAIGGGAYPMDSTRTFGTGGMTDATGKYNPTWVAVAGNSYTHYKSTFAVNSYAPPYLDKCVMHVNGPLVITNSELTVAATLQFQINSMQFARGPSGGAAQLIGIAVGSPSSANTNVLWFTNDGGKLWQASPTVVTTISPSPPSVFRAVSIYSSQYITPRAQYAVAAGDNGIIYLSKDAGSTWFQLLNDTSTSAINQPFSKVVISSKSNNNSSTMRAFLMYSVFTPASSGIPATNKSYMRYFDSTTTNFVPSTKFFVSVATQLSFGDSTQSDQFTITGIDADNNTAGAGVPAIWVCGTGAILRYVVSNVVGGQPLLTFTKMGDNYNAIQVAYFDATFVVAVGEGIISVTHNSGITWEETVFADGITFLSVYIYDANKIIACGYNGSMAYSINGGVTWAFVPPDMIGAGGSGWQWTSSNSTLTDISMPDVNTIILRRLSDGEYPFPGKSRIYTGWLPNLFNRSNNHVLDVCGNMMLSGDLWLNDGGVMQSNTPATQTVSLFPETRQSISFGPKTAQISTGNLVVGSTSGSTSGKIGVSTGALVVRGGSTVMGNLMAGGFMFVSGAGIQGAEGSLAVDPNEVTRQIKIGDGQIGNTFIKIGNTDGIGGDTVRNYISIGGPNDFVTFKGTLTLPQVNSTNEKTYNLNFGASTTISSAFYCGLNFYNNGFFNAGWFLTDLSMEGFLLKSPQDPTVIRFFNKSLNVITDVDALSNSVVIMRKPAPTSIDISFEMVSVDIDYRNILLRNIAVSSMQTINSDVTITGTLNTDRNVVMDMDCNVGKDITCNRNLDVMGASHLFGAVTFDNNVTWTGQKFALTGSLVQGGPNTLLQFNQIDAVPKLIPDANGNILSLGCGSNTDVVIVGGSSARAVRIGTLADTDLTRGNVYVGGTNYTSWLSGNVILPKTVYTAGTWTAGQPPSTGGLLQFSTKTIEVNASATGTGTSAAAGLLVRDNNGTAGAGRIIVSNDMSGWLFVAPKNTGPGANNVVNFAVNTLSLQPGGPGTGDPANNAFVVLQSSTSWNGGVLFDSSYTVTTSNTITGVANFSNPQAATSSTTGAVRISTGGLGVAGNIYVGGNVFVPTRQVIVNKVAASDPASQMEVGGNTIMQRLTVGNVALTNPAYVMTVSGQMMQSAGFVWQF